MAAPLRKLFRGNQILSNISWTMLAKAFAMLFYFLTDIVIANTLSVEEYGIWNYFFSIKTMLAYLCYFGINQATKIIIARTEDDAKKKLFFQLSSKIRAVVNILFAIFVIALTPYMASLLDAIGNNYVSKFLLYFSGILAAFNAFQEFFKATAYGLNNTRLALEFTTIEYGVTFLCVTFFTVVYKDSTGILIGYIIAGIACLTVSYILLGKKTFLLKHTTVNFKTVPMVAELFKYAIPLLMANLADLVSEFDIVMLGNYSDAEQIALYNIGKKICTKAGQINLAIATGSTMTFALINKANVNSKLISIKKVFSLNIAITLLVSVLLIPASIWGIPFLYGDNYKEATYTTLCFIPYYFLYGSSILSAFFLDFRGKSSIRSVISVLSIVLNIMLNFIFIPMWGAIGAIVTTIIAQGVYAVFLFFETINLVYKITKLQND